MKNMISQTKKTDPSKSSIYIVNSKAEAKKLKPKAFSNKNIDELLAFKKPLVAKSPVQLEMIVLCNPGQGIHNNEALRKAGYTAAKSLNCHKHSAVQVTGGTKEEALMVAEGIAMTNYQFQKYWTDKKRYNSLSKIEVCHNEVSKKDIDALNGLLNGVFYARDLVNEPQSYLTASQFSKDVSKMAREAGFSIEVFNKKKIESLKMGGLLAVNRGSIEPPTFNILEHKPKNAKNKKPFVLVGKGVMYDTGGLSLKPTANSMDFMKSDMAGSAAVVGTLYSVAKNNLPVWVVGLVPATDNRPGDKAYAPGDVIGMYNGKTVEVLNTDAEGRMILADALTYAVKYKPELVIDLATLTGAATRTVGHHAIVSMGTAEEMTHQQLKDSGMSVHERLAELPFWEEYGDMLKSDIADVKNIGGPMAGAITAGKFLEIFTQDKNGKPAYPWIHLDIAGPAFLDKEDSYRGKNGSGVGVRLLYHFLNNQGK